MTSEMLGRIAAQDVQCAMEANQAVIAERLATVCNDEEIAAAVVAGMMMSAELSVQIVIKALEEAGVIGLPPDGAPVILE
jgi:hypothetical protein|uniref:hypothetical protein n=1 Tax=Dysosmobacter welbionis TaxID=2093857 RepID=UPI003FF02020